MDSNLTKILNIFLYSLLGITVVLTILFVNGGITPESINSLYPEPVFTTFLLNWTYFLFVLSLVITFVFAGISVIRNPKDAVRSLIVLAIFGGIILIAWSMSDGTELNLVGYTGKDNVESILKFADTILYTSYVLLVGALLAAFGSVLFKLRR
ncbi:MAG: hypothetical protein KAI79_07585 [Bacteroidales bacterium]|nr:hypothetical protein [Bacteroidales bacterium]